jgi:hypothetical protein
VLHDAIWHMPPMHVGIAFESMHALPHPPQLATDVERLVVHPVAPPQFANPVGHVEAWHAPALHSGVPDGQLVVQLPQCIDDVLRLISQPFVGLPSQSAKPALHAPSVHAPATHDADALGKLQTFPHAPQLFTSVCVLIKHPSAGFPPHTAKPVRHTEHVPSGPHPAPGVAAQFASVQHTRHAEPQHIVPDAQLV